MDLESTRAFPSPQLNVVADALIASVRILGRFEPTPEVLTQVDRIYEHVRQSGTSLQTAAEALKIPLTAPYCAFILTLLLRNWFEGGSAQIDTMEGHLILGHLALDADSVEDQVVIRLTKFLSALGFVSTRPDAPKRMIREACEDLAAVGSALESLSDWDRAVRCFDVCCNLVGLLGHPDYRSYANRARKHIRRLDDARVVAMVLLKAASASVAQAEQDPNIALAAYDALYDAILAMADQPEVYRQWRAFLNKCLQQERYRPLAPLYVLGDPELERSRLPEPLRETRLVPLVSSQDQQSWAADLLRVRIALVEAENGRLALEPKCPDTALAEADWTTWAFTHPAYYRAIPDAESFLRDPARENLMLVLAHEITHIFSMNGYVGLTIVAARAALMHLMVTLWHRTEGPPSPDEVLAGLPPLRDHDVVRLAEAEQTVHLIRKLQILHTVWAPWFEGIAIFAELADPKDDPDAYSPAMGVLQNLIDRTSKPGEETTREELQASVEEFLAKNEERYSAAVAAHAVDRLYSYLVAYHHSYLTGYLAVRTVVAAWRRTLGEPLSGAIAAKILLHVTRTGSRDAVPSLSTSVSAFLGAATQAHVLFLRQLMRFSADDLRAIQKPFSSSGEFNSAEWLNGRLVLLSAQETKAREADLRTYATRRGQEAWSDLRGSRSDTPEAGSGDHSRFVMSEVALRLGQVTLEHDWVNLALKNLVGQLSVLPIAEVDARFWLNSSAKSVFCMLRTSEGEPPHRSPGYNGLLFTLNDEEFGELMRRVNESGESRMKVRRIADIAAPGVATDRGYGRHCLVLQYQDWLEVQMRGLVSGVRQLVPSLIDDVRARCVGNPIIRFDRYIVGDGHKFTEQVRSWIDEEGEWMPAEQSRLSVGGWVQYVRRVCSEVLSDDRERDRARVQGQILADVLGLTPERSEAVLLRGLRAFTQPAPEALATVIDLLSRSASRPLLSTSIPVCVTGDLFAQTPLGLDTLAPEPA